MKGISMADVVLVDDNANDADLALRVVMRMASQVEHRPGADAPISGGLTPHRADRGGGSRLLG